VEICGRSWAGLTDAPVRCRVCGVGYHQHRAHAVRRAVFVRFGQAIVMVAEVGAGVFGTLRL
jgi:hypothetical protein